MEIQKQLPHFIDENVLLAVTGSVGYKLYKAGNGSIEELGEFNSKDAIQYDEEKVMSQRSGGGKTFGVGISDKTNEMNKGLEENFLHHLKDRLMKLSGEKFDKIILFSPAHVLGSVEETVPASMKDSLYLSVKGNYTDHHPFELLKLIKEEPEGKTKHYSA